MDETVKKKTGRPKKKPGEPKSPYTTPSPEALARRKDKNPSVPKSAETLAEKGYNASQIEHILKVHEIAQNADRHDLNTLKSCFVAYLRLCQEDGFPVGNLAAYASMGMNKNAFESLMKRDDPDIKEFCSLVRTTCAMYRESSIAGNKLNPVIGIFWQRNFDGLRNDTEQTQAINEQEENSESGNYKDKYKNLI